MPFEPTSAEEERVAKATVDAPYAVHRTLGPGLLEKVYEACLCHELRKRNLSYERQVVVPVVYDGIAFEEGLRLDVLVEGFVICEIKAVETMHPVFHAQVLTYLKLTGKRLGFLKNFNVPLFTDGIQRVIL